MFCLLGRQKSNNWRVRVILTLLVFGLYNSTQLGRSYFIAMLACGFIVAVFTLSPLRRLRRTEPEWILFTAEGVGSRHREGEFGIVPWSAFRRVTFHRSRLFPNSKTPGRRTWQIRLYREPNPIFHKLGGRRLPPTMNDVHFEIETTEEHAQQIVAELHKRFLGGWMPDQSSIILSSSRKIAASS